MPNDRQHQEEDYQEIELFDKVGLFSNGRIPRNNLPYGLFCYDLRGSDVSRPRRHGTRG